MINKRKPRDPKIAELMIYHAMRNILIAWKERLDKEDLTDDQVRKMRKSIFLSFIAEESTDRYFIDADMKETAQILANQLEEGNMEEGARSMSLLIEDLESNKMRPKVLFTS